MSEETSLLAKKEKNRLYMREYRNTESGKNATRRANENSRKKRISSGKDYATREHEREVEFRWRDRLVFSDASRRSRSAALSVVTKDELANPSFCFVLDNCYENERLFEPFPNFEGE